MAEKRAKKTQKRSGPVKKMHSASPFSPQISEQVLRDVERVMQGREFETTEEANAFLATLVGPGLKRALEDVPPLSPQEEALELVDRAMEAPTKAKALALTRQALAKDPDCVDALVNMVAFTSRSAEDVISGLEKAVAAGERSLGKHYFDENKGDFWGLIETRPYMRARHRLADMLLDFGREAEAIGHFEALLELNPNDNQGIRELLLNCYLTRDNLDGARRLLLAYKEDISAVFAWGRLLERILSEDFKAAEAALASARKGNPFVELYLTGKKKPPLAMPEYYSLGSEEEALVCVDILGGAWIAHVKALFWLLSQRETQRLPHRQSARSSKLQ